MVTKWSEAISDGKIKKYLFERKRMSKRHSRKEKSIYKEYGFYVSTSLILSKMVIIDEAP